jgi:hypothetical protein
VRTMVWCGCWCRSCMSRMRRTERASARRSSGSEKYSGKIRGCAGVSPLSCRGVSSLYGAYNRPAKVQNRHSPDSRGFGARIVPLTGSGNVAKMIVIG